jgi:chorismate-pyruvate lyase
MIYTIMHALKQDGSNWKREVLEFDEDQKAIDYAKTNYESLPEIDVLIVFQGDIPLGRAIFENDPIYELL